MPRRPVRRALRRIQFHLHFKVNIVRTFAVPQYPYQWCCALLACGWLAGCGFGQAPIVNEEMARDSLVTFLDAWTEGETPDDFESQIIAKDSAWKSGHKLVSYEILGEKNVGTSLHVVAKLNLESADGVKITPTANYIVGTHPVITVFRDED